MSRPNRRIEAVIFDLDDTLIDWSGQTASFGSIVRPHIDNLYAYFQAERHPLPDPDTFFDIYRAVVVAHWDEAKKTWSGVNFGEALLESFEAAGLDVNRIDLDDVLRAYDVAPIPGVTLFPDTISVLETLKQQSYKIGLVTNSMLPMWMRDIELRDYDIIRYFDARITSGDTGYMKPHPAIYHHILDLLAVEPHKAVFVGDRPANDIAGANEAGLVSVLMSPDHLNRELNGIQPDYIITSLTELLSILDALETGVEESDEETRPK